MGRSKQGAIVRRGRRLYARIRWTENVNGQSIHLAPWTTTGHVNSMGYGFRFLLGARRICQFLSHRGTI